MRKEGKAFASDINGADAMRTPEAEPRLHQISLHHRSLSCACGGMIFLSHVTLERTSPGMVNRHPDGTIVVPRYNAVLAAIDLFTTKQQRHLQVGWALYGWRVV